MTEVNVYISKTRRYLKLQLNLILFLKNNTVPKSFELETVIIHFAFTFTFQPLTDRTYIFLSLHTQAVEG